jgi:hypothetical protein
MLPHGVARALPPAGQKQRDPIAPLRHDGELYSL